MKKVLAPVQKGRMRQESVQHASFELEIASLLSDLSAIYNKSMSLNERLQSGPYQRSSTEVFEGAIMIKNALRILADAMLHLAP